MKRFAYLILFLSLSTFAAEPFLLDYQARMYDPEGMHFISPDTVIPDPANPQSLNRYSYVYNNPMNYTDPSGHFPDPVTLVGCLVFGCDKSVYFSVSLGVEIDAVVGVEGSGTRTYAYNFNNGRVDVANGAAITFTAGEPEAISGGVTFMAGTVNNVDNNGWMNGSSLIGNGELGGDFFGQVTAVAEAFLPLDSNGSPSFSEDGALIYGTGLGVGIGINGSPTGITGDIGFSPINSGWIVGGFNPGDEARNLLNFQPFMDALGRVIYQGDSFVPTVQTPQ